MENTSTYSISISKQQVAEMPLMVYPGHITIVDTISMAHEALRILSVAKIVGFDTETRPAFRKGCQNKVALMQISTEEMCFLFRLNKIGIPKELKEFLENPEIIKIGLSVHDDFHSMSHTDDTIKPQGFIDLQKLVRQYEIADISLQKIYAIIFGGRISKGQRLTNWEADVLTPAQQAYAALDAWACLKIYNHLDAGMFDIKNSPYRHLYEPPTPL